MSFYDSTVLNSYVQVLHHFHVDRTDHSIGPRCIEPRPLMSELWHAEAVVNDWQSTIDHVLETSDLMIVYPFPLRDGETHDILDFRMWKRFGAASSISFPSPPLPLTLLPSPPPPYFFPIPPLARTPILLRYVKMRSRRTSLKEAPITAPKEELAPLFSQMLDLMREQNKMMAEQGKTQTEQSQILRDHSKMLEILEKDATRAADKVVDDKAYEARGLRDESTWGALDKEALAKMKVMVDGWKDLMNVSLIFIALFLTVVTAFISPIIQLFSTPSSSSTSKPAPPPTSLQLVALFYYLALMFSICNSVMCVLGLQWAGRLLSMPPGKTNLERALNRERRKVLAEQRLLPLMGVLFWTLLLSIAFFVIGFLIQFWALSFSFDERAPILIIGAVAATALAITILGVILATTYHAAIHENSPFVSPLSSASMATWLWIKRVTKKSKMERQTETDEAPQLNKRFAIPAHLPSRFRRIQRSVKRIFREPDLAPEAPFHELLGGREGARIESEEKEGEPIEVLMKEAADDTATVQAFKAYARLVINTNDAEVLERAVPSFVIGEWCKSGGDLLPLFLAVRDRFLATDTSFRVKETVQKQLVDCREWSGWTDEDGWWRRDLEGNDITRWCRDQFKDLVNQSHESHRQFFSAWVFFTSLDPNNDDLRGDPRDDSHEESLVRVLYSFDQEGELGDRRDVFWSAVWECRSDDVTRILSRGYQYSVLRSLLRNPYRPWDDVGGLLGRPLGRIKDVVAFITRGNEVAVLGELAKFFSNLPDIKPVGDYCKNLLVIDFLSSLTLSLPSTFTAPQSFDLAPTLSLLLRYQFVIGYSLPRYSATLIYFLDHGGFELLSSLRPAHDFFQLCITRSSNDQIDETVSDRAQFYLSKHHEAFTPLPGPSDQELEDLVDALVAYKKNPSAQDLEDHFVDAAMGCDCLIREQNRNEVQDILSRVGHLPILEAFVRDPRLHLKHISSLVPLTIKGREHTYLRDLSPAITNPSLLDHSDAYQRIIEFLALVLQHLPSDFTVPQEFDLSQVLSLFMRHNPDYRTWRKFSDALMQYLDHGALEALVLSDKNSVRPFLDLCVMPSLEMEFYWDQNQQTSESTSKRAAELLKKLDELDATRRASEATRITGGANPPESINETTEPQQTVMPRLWHAFISALGGLGLKGNERKARGGDVELALQSPSGS
ncbi:hypothetical protein SISNIDRAFT_541213 [Sistotremastrum niveocremeum HHB9708]|uniref:DUF6535 domain-containing protein n=1 Tax=Sistotremastrum niveocremeum HHB9708 TaxID=1314777 RepID=A0A164MK99_9AGAM|nr:hypothetical protein SISNIDRAFT_541213 [Sistotremastrum niveocremeum HHB9708]